MAFAGAPLPADKVGSTLAMLGYAGSMAWWFGRRAVAARTSGVRYRWIDGKDLLKEDNVVGRLVFRDFLPRALEARQFVPAPPPALRGAYPFAFAPLACACGPGAAPYVKCAARRSSSYSSVSRESSADDVDVLGESDGASECTMSARKPGSRLPPRGAPRASGVW